MSEEHGALELAGRQDTQLATQGGVAVKATEIQAEVQAAAVLAMQRPRDEAAAWVRIQKSCKRPHFADGAEYSFPRGGSRVRGPSVKLAREMARCWGNIRHGIRVLSMSEDQVQLEGWAWDLETNTRVSSEARFSRKVQRKRGGQTVWVEPDERDLRELVNKHGAIAVRNALLQLVPPDVVDEAVGLCRKTLADAAEGKLAEDRDAVLRRLAVAWEHYGVDTDVLGEYLGKPLEKATGEDVAELRSIFQSIRDGNSQVADYFDLATKRATQAQDQLLGKEEEEGKDA